MPGSARKVIVEFLGKDASLGKTANEVGTKTDRLGQRMRQVGKVGALALVAGAGLAAKSLYDMGKAAAEDQVAQSNLARQLHASAGATKGQVAAVETWISAQGRALGVTDDDLRPALAKLVVATGDVGKAQKLASLAMNVSAGTGKDLGQVSTALAKAQNGNVAGLSRLGVATKDAAGHTLSFSKIQENLSKQFGGAATDKANTFSGKMARLKLIFDETKESIGYKLIPIVTKLGTWFLTKGLPAISAFSKELKEKLGPVIDWVRGLFSGGLGGMDGDTKKNLTSILASFQAFVQTLKSLWATFGPTLVATVRAVFGPIKTILGGQLNIITGILKTFTALLHGDWAGVWAGLKQIVSGFFTVVKGIIALGWDLIKGIFKVAGIALRGIFSGIWAGIKSLAAARMNGLVSAVKAVPGKIAALAGKFRDAGKAVLNGLLNGLKGGGKFVSEIAGKIWTSVKGMINAAITKINQALPNSIGKGPFRVSLPANPIPRLAAGAIVKKRPGGILANIGEGKYDEGVFPLDKNGVPRGMGGGDTYMISITGAMDADAVGRQLEQILLRRKRTTGRPLAFA